MVNSVNNEARVSYLKFQRKAQSCFKNCPVKKKGKRKSLPSDPVPGITESMTSPPASSSRASAILLFRKQYIAAQTTAGKTRDWFTKDAWKDVKTAFSELPAQERTHFEKLAKCVNFNRRLRGKAAAKKTVAIDIRPEQLALPLLDQDHSLELMPVAQASVESTVPNAFLSTFEHTHLQQCASSVDCFVGHLNEEFQKAGKRIGVDPWPLREENILKALLSLRCRGIPAKGAVKHLSKVCQHLAGPKSTDEQDQFPSTVIYHRHCADGVCCTLYPQSFKMQCQIADALHSMARRFKSPSDLVRSDLLIEITVFGAEGNPFQKLHFIVTSVAFRGGTQQPTESYVSLVPAQGESSILTLSASPHVSSKTKTPWPSPINRGSCGSVISMSTVQLAAHLVSLESDMRLPNKVLIERVRYEDISRSTVRLAGKDETWDPVVVSALSPAVGKGSSKDQKRSDIASGSAAKPSSSSLDYLDFLGDVEPPLQEAASSCSYAPGSHHAYSCQPKEFEDFLAQQLLEALGDSLGSDDTGQEPKWRRDFEGLLDPSQVAELEEDWACEKSWETQSLKLKLKQFNSDSSCTLTLSVTAILATPTGFTHRLLSLDLKSNSFAKVVCCFSINQETQQIRSALHDRSMPARFVTLTPLLLPTFNHQMTRASWNLVLYCIFTTGSFSVQGLVLFHY